MTAGLAPHLPRSVARLAAVQALYEMDVAGSDAGSVISEFRNRRFGAEIDGFTLPEGDLEHFALLVRGVVARQGEIDRLITAHLAKGWQLARLDILLRALLRAAVFEIEAMPEVPARVTIAEYLEVAHDYYAGEEPGFVNAILDKIGRQLRPGDFPGSKG